ncbi:MAG: preprotein translocase subunit YajC [Alphaproteobacteria bacterium]|nr:MAG: preprotein translocase subunit YajC [Alphaproteobacteria bacterium]
MWVSPAWAQTESHVGTETVIPAGAPQPMGGGDKLMSFMPLLLILLLFYFILIRPQQKRAKDHQSMLDALRRGDRVVTSGGLIGSVVRLSGDNEEVTVELAEGVRVRVLRSAISEIRAKTEPAKAHDDTKTEDEGDKKAS